jgi:hypothetical protein
VADYYTLETFRDHIIGNVQIHVSLIPESFPDDWNYCPCAAQTRCNVNRKCIQKVGLYFSGTINFMAIIEILYIKSQGTGYIIANQLSLARLIEKGFIDQAQLRKINF